MSDIRFKHETDAVDERNPFAHKIYTYLVTNGDEALIRIGTTKAGRLWVHVTRDTKQVSVDIETQHSTEPAAEVAPPYGSAAARIAEIRRDFERFRYAGDITYNPLAVFDLLDIIDRQSPPPPAELTRAAAALFASLTVLRAPDPSLLWVLGGEPLERDYQALKQALKKAPLED